MSVPTPNRKALQDLGLLRRYRGIENHELESAYDALRLSSEDRWLELIRFDHRQARRDFVYKVHKAPMGQADTLRYSSTIDEYPLICQQLIDSLDDIQLKYIVYMRLRQYSIAVCKGALCLTAYQWRVLRAKLRAAVLAYCTSSQADSGLAMQLCGRADGGKNNTAP